MAHLAVPAPTRPVRGPRCRARSPHPAVPRSTQSVPSAPSAVATAQTAPRSRRMPARLAPAARLPSRQTSDTSGPPAAQTPPASSHSLDTLSPAPQFAPAAGFVAPADLVSLRPRLLPFVKFPSRHLTRLCSFRIGGPQPVAYGASAAQQAALEAAVQRAAGLPQPVNLVTREIP